MVSLASAVCHKSRIARQFSRAASSYDYAAQVQKDIAQDALSYLPKTTGRLLDIGCGTGRNTQSLASSCQHLLALDLAYGMLSYAQQQHINKQHDTCWLQGDAEHLPLQNNAVEGVFSSMALQWCKHPQQVMAEISRVLKPASKAVLAIMCDGSFSQLTQSWQQLDRLKHVNDFASAQVWQKSATNQGLEVNMSVKDYTTWHTDIRQLLASIKSIGANVVLADSTEQRPLNRQTLQQLDTTYRNKFAIDGQLPLTYRVCYLQCKKY